MVEPGNGRLSVSRQCELLGLSRSGYYYRSRPVSKEDLWLVQLIDEEYTRHPFFGTRRLSDWLGVQGHAVGRDHVRTGPVVSVKSIPEGVFRPPLPVLGALI